MLSAHFTYLFIDFIQIQANANEVPTEVVNSVSLLFNNKRITYSINLRTKIMNSYIAVDKYFSGKLQLK